MTAEASIVWAPQPGPQTALVHCPLPEVFFGGSRGGGKTDGILGKWAIKAGRYGRNFNAIFFRKTMPSADDVMERAAEIYTPLGGKWGEQKHQWTFPEGGRIRFRPMENVKDADKYQGQNVTDACVEEAGLYADSRAVDKLNGVLRSARGTPTQLILTANPGGPGHTWLKARYIDPAPMGMRVHERVLPNKRVHRYIYIPSRVQDNRVLLQQDPDYITRLYLVGNDALVKAWLEGDWNAIEGAFFDDWDTGLHVVRPFRVPSHWMKFRSQDWGSAKPFSVGWWAVASEMVRAPCGAIIPKGALVRYREWYGMKRDPVSKEAKPNVGVKLTAEQVGQGIVLRQDKTEKFAYHVADPSMWAEDGGKSLAQRQFEKMKEMGDKVPWKRADNSRVARDGHIGGWDQVRQRLIGEEGRPMLYIFSTCEDFIRTVPVLQHDELRMEDVDTNGEDHVADETRYACLSRPYITDSPARLEEMKGLDGLTMDRMWKEERMAAE